MSLIQREARLMMTSFRIIFRVVKRDGLQSSSTMIPKLNQIASSSNRSGEEAIVAMRLINAYRNINGAIYDGKKHGVVHVFKTRFSMLQLGGTKGNNNKFQQITQKNEKVGGGGAKVAFVITGSTRQQLRALGYDDNVIRKLKPSQALDIAESNIHRTIKDQLLDVTKESTQKVDMRSSNNETQKVDESDEPNTNTSFDMHSEIEKLRLELKVEKGTEAQGGTVKGEDLTSNSIVVLPSQDEEVDVSGQANQGGDSTSVVVVNVEEKEK